MLYKGQKMDFSKYYFAQQKYSTYRMFGEHWTTSTFSPHYEHVLGDSNIYTEYLQKSWKDLPSKSTNSKIREFDMLYRDIKKNGIKTPIQTVIRLNNDKLIFHGNHRFACAKELGIEFPEEEISIDEYLDFNLLGNGYRFTSDDNGVPYQSIYHKGKLIRQGRRKDLQERHDMIRLLDLSGKRVFDFGGNIGTSSFMAYESGANVEMWDIPHNMNSAARLAVLFDYPIDFNMPHGDYDTLFLFSVHAHVKIPKINAKVIYFETHEDGILPKRYKELYHVEKLGKLGKRNFYRLTK